MIIAHPLFCQRLQFFGNVDLPGAALGVAHGQIIGWTVFLALHALTARLATLREPLNEGGTQNGTQPAKLLDELAPTQRELMYLRTRHVLTLAQVLRQCKQKVFGKALFLLRSRAGSEQPTADRTKTDGRQAFFWAVRCQADRAVSRLTSLPASGEITKGDRHEAKSCGAMKVSEELACFDGVLL